MGARDASWPTWTEGTSIGEAAGLLSVRFEVAARASVVDGLPTFAFCWQVRPSTGCSPRFEGGEAEDAGDSTASMVCRAEAEMACWQQWCLLLDPSSSSSGGVFPSSSSFCWDKEEEEKDVLSFVGSQPCAVRCLTMASLPLTMALVTATVVRWILLGSCTLVPRRQTGLKPASEPHHNHHRRCFAQTRCRDRFSNPSE